MIFNIITLFPEIFPGPLNHSLSGKALNENNVIATLLPGTTFFLGQSNYAPYTKLKEAGVEIALATDFNAGSCSIKSMPFIISLACLFLKMDILEAIKACTYTSAKSLMLEDTIGSIEEGKKADLIIWEIDKIENERIAISVIKIVLLKSKYVADITSGAKMSTLKGLVKPPVKYKSKISCKRS